MPPTWSRIVLWLLVINLGISLGAGLYEGRIVVPGWLALSPDGAPHWNAEAARRDDTGLRFWAFVTTGPLTLITLANLFAARRASGALRRWWLAAGLAALCDRVFTFAYFIPTMVSLMQQADSVEAARRATSWVNLNYLRHAMVFIALIAALRAFSLLYQERGATRAA